MGNFVARAYSHTQRGPWSLVLATIGLATLAGGWVGRREPAALVICGGVSLVLLLLATAFHSLTVADVDGALSVAFGPLRLAQMRIPYTEILRVEQGRTTVLDGWGIHMSPRGGWVWNIWGRDCVVIEKSRGILRVGTDDAPALAAFLRSRVGADVPRVI